MDQIFQMPKNVFDFEGWITRQKFLAGPKTNIALPKISSALKTRLTFQFFLVIVFLEPQSQCRPLRLIGAPDEVGP